MDYDTDYIEMQQERKADAERKAAEDEIYNKGLVKQRLEGVPQWMDAYNAFKKNEPNFMKMQRAAGYNDIDRRWNSDDDTKTLKTKLDGEYKGLLDAYNKAHGTKYQPDARQIGVNAQPNDWDHTTHDGGGWINKQVNSVGQFFEDPSKALSNLGGEISKSKLAQTVISMAAAAYGVPPNVTMALLSANNIGQGQDPMEVARGIAMQYAGGKLGDMAGGATQGALKGVDGLSAGTIKGLTGAASGAAATIPASIVKGQDIFKNALVGGATGLAGAAGKEVTDLTGNKYLGSAAGTLTGSALTGKDVDLNKLGTGLAAQYAGDEISDLAKKNGWNKLPQGLEIEGFKIPGGYDVNLKDNLVKGIDANVGKQLVAETGPAGKNLAGAADLLGNAAKVVDKPTLQGIDALTNKVNAVTSPKARPTGVRPPPAGARPPPGGVKPAPAGAPVTPVTPAAPLPPQAVLDAMKKRKPPGG